MANTSHFMSIEGGENNVLHLDIYINKAGDTIARDYFNHLSVAVELFRQLKHTYQRNGLETALLLTDSNGREIMWYIPEETNE